MNSHSQRISPYHPDSKQSAFGRFLSWIHDNQRFAAALVILFSAYLPVICRSFLRRSVQQSENKITQTNEKVKRGKEEMAAEETVEIKLEKRSREPLSEVLGYRVTKEEAQEIREYAKRNGVNVPDVIRSSLRTTGVIGNEVKP